jgi:hypothetical protein
MSHSRNAMVNNRTSLYLHHSHKKDVDESSSVVLPGMKSITITNLGNESVVDNALPTYLAIYTSYPGPLQPPADQTPSH